jgi:hypothetical protein
MALASALVLAFDALPCRAAVSLPITDIMPNQAAKPAVQRIVNQGIMNVDAAGKFSPTQVVTRRQFAIYVQKLLGLRPPRTSAIVTDVPRTDAAYSAILAMQTYMQAQAFCPGCSLSTNFYPNQPISLALEGIVMSSVLIERHKAVLVPSEEADRLLENSPQVKGVPAPARRYLATALQYNLLPSTAAAHLSQSANRINTAQLLDKTQQNLR